MTCSSPLRVNGRAAIQTQVVWLQIPHSAHTTFQIKDFPVAQMVKNLPAMQETRVQSLGQEDPLEKEWQATAVFLPGGSHGQRSLSGYGLWGCKESDMTERLTHIPFKLILSRIICSLTKRHAQRRRELKWRKQRLSYLLNLRQIFFY